jgi:Polyketide cyclase / dehydrase and lipid transport
VRSSFTLAWLTLIASPVGAVDLGQDFAQHGDIEVRVVLDAAEQSGHADATVRIHAPRDVVWSLITSCSEALTLVPGLVGCKVLETSADRSWQKIQHVMDYSWYVPKLTYVFRASYEGVSRVSIERISGDLRTLSGSWELSQDHDYTVARYQIDLAPGFWVPRWIERAALKRDLPKMMRALRARAESVQSVIVR